MTDFLNALQKKKQPVKQELIEMDVEKLDNTQESGTGSEISILSSSLNTILQNNFQDSEKNVTRFLIMSNNLNTPDSNDDDFMTTLVFELKSIPAALYKALGGLASNGVNLTKLESYINPQGLMMPNYILILRDIQRIKRLN